MLLIPLLAGFRERFPAIALEVLVDNRVLNLSRREADLALRLMRPTQPQLLARRLARVGMGLYASRAYVARRGRPDAPGLEGHDVIGYDEASAPAAESEWLATRAARATVVLRTNSARGLLSAVASGLGLALLPCFVADGVAGLVQVRPPREAVTRDLWLLVHHELKHAARVRALTDFLVAEVGARAEALAGVAGGAR
jgi:DNA-binding transcriptional LysR family regulator